MKDLLQAIKDMDNTKAQIDYLRIVANAANSVADKLEVLRHGETPCIKCKKAHAEWHKEWRAR